MPSKTTFGEDTRVLDFSEYIRVATPGANWKAQLSSFMRQLQVATLNYFVRTDGSDSNNGLSNTAGGAFLTIQRAANVIASTIDIGGQTVAINVGTGTFDGVNFSAALTGGGGVQIAGNGSANTTIRGTASTAAIYASVPQTTAITVSSTTLTDPNAAGFGCINLAAMVVFSSGSDVIFGASTAGSHISLSAPGAFYATTATYSINGGAASSHLECIATGARIRLFHNCTLSGTLTFGTFAHASSVSEIKCNGMSFSGGTITGTRYLSELNAVINTGGGGASFFPGSVAGSTATGGQYA